MTNRFDIRTYHPNDKDCLLKLLKLNVPEYFAEEEISDFEKYLEHKIESYFVIELTGEIIGAGGINFDNAHDAAKISWDVVHPKFQGKGAGRQLLQYRLNLIKVLGITNISVRTSQLAYKFYEKNGFGLVNIVRDYWGEGFDLFEMNHQEGR
jgi:ribosomal-protein-alanine N-acetyltransferase